MFGKEKADSLIADLTRHPLPGLTAEEHAHLFVVIQTTLEVQLSLFFYEN